MYQNVSGSYIKLGGLKSGSHQSRPVKMEASGGIKEFLRQDSRQDWLTEGWSGHAGSEDHCPAELFHIALLCRTQGWHFESP